MLSGFQAGLSWIAILRRRDAFREAFRGFDPETVARFTEADVVRLLGNSAIIRSKAKIRATIAGARAYVTMAEAGEDFSTFAWAFVGNKPIGNTGPMPAQNLLSEKISNDLKQRGFKFVGPVIVYAWMQSSGMINDHLADCFRRNAVSVDKPVREKGIDKATPRAIGIFSVGSRASKQRNSKHALDQFDDAPRGFDEGNATRGDGEAHEHIDVLGENPRYRGGSQEDEGLGL
jgi:DNA-3-methyladenine glycosylase I